MITNFKYFLLESHNWKNKFRPVTQLFSILPKSVDYRILEHMLTWKKGFYKSPYGNSFYSDRKTWENTVEGSYRMSDHWNFYSQGKLHSKTKEPIPDNYWTIGQYNNGEWDIIMSYPFTNEDKVKRAQMRTDYIGYHKEELMKKNKNLELLKSYMEKGDLYCNLKHYSNGIFQKEYNGKVIRLKTNKIAILIDSNEEQIFNHSDFYNSDIKFIDGKNNLIYHKEYKEKLD